MSPKKKAKELLKKYSKGKDDHGWYLCEFDSCAKQCALIAVDEVLDSFKLNSGIDIVGNAVINFAIRKRKYWKEVKQEIEKL